MNWFISTMSSSIGKKLMMAVTGLSFCAFLVVHLIGNLTLYGGQDFFNSYVEHLHGFDPVIKVAELGLLLFAVIHVTTGLILFLGNLKSRPSRYAVDKSGGGRTIGSRTMPYTGVILLVFILIHLIDFHFADRTNTTLFNIVSGVFQNPIYILFYTAAVVIAAIHISHGFWSAFQTIGANHPKYMPFLKGLGIGFSVIIAIGFGFIPVYISFIS